MADLPQKAHEVLNELSKERLIDTVLLQAEKIAELVKENAELKQENDDLKSRIRSKTQQRLHQFEPTAVF